MSQSGLMARPKKIADNDRHKPNRMMRINKAIAAQLDSLAKRNATSAAQEANRLIREGLERLGLWPPPQS